MINIEKTHSYRLGWLQGNVKSALVLFPKMPKDLKKHLEGGLAKVDKLGENK